MSKLKSPLLCLVPAAAAWHFPAKPKLRFHVTESQLSPPPKPTDKCPSWKGGCCHYWCNHNRCSQAGEKFYSEISVHLPLKVNWNARAKSLEWTARVSSSPAPSRLTLPSPNYRHTQDTGGTDLLFLPQILQDRGQIALLRQRKVWLFPLPLGGYSKAVTPWGLFSQSFHGHSSENKSSSAIKVYWKRQSNPASPICYPFPFQLMQECNCCRESPRGSGFKTSSLGSTLRELSAPSRSSLCRIAGQQPAYPGSSRDTTGDSRAGLKAGTAEAFCS